MPVFSDSLKKGSVLYLTVTGLFFLGVFILFIFFPRPEYSELEKRDLAEFPKYGDFKGNLADYTSGISEWFSNTEPFRDNFLTMSMGMRNLMKLNIRNDSEAVSFHATSDSMEEGSEAAIDTISNEVVSLPHVEENAKVANAGIIVAGNPPNARAMMAFGGSDKSGGAFISTVNSYAEVFPDKNIFVLVASSPGEFYMPEKVKGRNNPETPTLQNIKNGLIPSVKYVNAHDALLKHAAEDIFLRTDHHWAPLGAFYAAEEFAKTANVPFRSLDSYDKHVVHGFVGSMYGYSKDIAVKKSPEDFVYYTPKNLDYTTTYITYNTNKDFQVTGESKPYTSDFFKSFKDGSGSAYLTFMGGDQHLVHVKTGTDSPRKLLVIKDSFGNAFPGYMFFSYSDVFVVDFRYFNKNMKQYVKDNGITDIAFVFNIFNVCNSGTFRRVNKFLTQRDGEVAKASLPENENQDKTDNDRVEEKNMEKDINTTHESSEKEESSLDDVVLPSESNES